MRQITGLILLAMSAFLLSLQAENVFIVGGDGTFGSCFWITDNAGANAVQTILPNASLSVAAYGVALSSTNAYIVGQDGGGNAALWIVGLDGTLPSSDISLGSGLIGYSVAVSQTNVYIVGGQNIPVLWITDLEGNIINQITLPNQAGEGAVALGVAITNSNIYITGNDSGASAGEGVLWITDLDGGNVNEVSLCATSEYGYAVCVQSDSVYVTGNDEFGNAYLWVTDLNGNLLNPVELPNGSFGDGHGIATSSTNVYIAGNIPGYPSLWITDLEGNNANQYTFTTDYGMTGAGGVALSSTQAYVVGADADVVAGLWLVGLDGTLPASAIDLPSNFASQAFGVVLLQPSPPSNATLNTVGSPFFKQITPNNPGQGLW